MLGRGDLRCSGIYLGDLAIERGDDEAGKGAEMQICRREHADVIDRTRIVSDNVPECSAERPKGRRLAYRDAP